MNSFFTKSRFLTSLDPSVGRGLELLHAHEQFDNFILCHELGLFLVHRGALILWCFPLLHYWRVFPGWYCTLGSMTCSDTRHLFCLVGGVSSTASPCMGLSMITVGLGVCDRSYTSSVSHSMYLSKSPAVGFGNWVSICLYSTVGSPGGDWVAFGPAGTADRMG